MNPSKSTNKSKNKGIKVERKSESIKVESIKVESKSEIILLILLLLSTIEELR